jgi:hypothetical protein
VEVIAGVRKEDEGQGLCPRRESRGSRDSRARRSWAWTWTRTSRFCLEAMKKAGWEYWPVALGILASFFAPQLREFVEPYRPWGLWVSFPMVAISIRPEIYMGTKMASLMPMAMLYLQFPIEGLLAKIALKGNVTPYGVMVQVLYFHGLCIMQLWLLNGGFWHLLGR